MSAVFLAYCTAAAAVLCTVAAFWLRRDLSARLRASPATILWLCCVVAGVGFCLWSVALERPDHSFDKGGSPMAIAIAFDLSPSMLAIPAPQFEAETQPRFERGKQVLVSFFDAIEEQRKPVIVSIIGFTRQANVLMGWDESVAQVREVLEFAVTPELFDSYGTSVEAAATAVGNVFEMLPQRLEDSRKLVIVVSDGEDTVSDSSLGYALESFANANVDLVALQTGLLDRAEGVPVYDTLGTFTGFRRMSTGIHTVPRTENMVAVAGSAAGRSLHLRAENEDSAKRLVQFAVRDDAFAGTIDPGLVPALGMFFIVSLICAMVLR